MARTTEFMKRNEARIIVYLLQAANPLKYGSYISDKLNIDYAYVMKLMEAMYQKGWIKTHIFKGRIYFNVTLQTPTKEARERLAEIQLKSDTENDTLPK